MAPLLLLHGFMDSPRTWDLVRPALERRHDVVAPAFPGHLGGPPAGEFAPAALADFAERVLDEADVELAHVAGNSLGAYAALALAERGRAASVVAFAPASPGVPAGLLERQAEAHARIRAAAPHADAIAATPQGRRRATEALTGTGERLPAELVAHLTVAAAAADAPQMLAGAAEHGWPLHPERIGCPVRIVWGTEDRLLPYPESAAWLAEHLPHADRVVLDGVGHAPQLDVPLEAAQLILGFTD